MASEENPKAREATRIECKVVFVKIIEINTKDESFEAEIYIECCWLDDRLFKNLLDPDLAQISKCFFLSFNTILLLDKFLTNKIYFLFVRLN